MYFYTRYEIQNGFIDVRVKTLYIRLYHMPNKKAAIKGLRQSEKNRERNLRVKTNVKFHLGKVEQLIKEGKTKEAIEALRAFQKAADKAAKGNVISPNKANRKKSALTKKIAKASSK